MKHNRDSQRAGDDAAHGADVTKPTGTERGRDAEKPQQVSRRGWADILWRTRQQMAADNLSIVAAGVAFYAFLAVVPALAAVLALYAFFADQGRMGAQLESLAQVVPSEAMPLLRQQIQRIVQNDQAAGISAVLGVLVAVYGSARATKGLMTGLNIAYDEREKRGFIRLNLTAFILTFAAILGVIVAVILVTALPALLDAIGLTAGSALLLNILRWPLLIGLFMGGLSVMYRFAPSREAPQWRWLSWGAGAASAFWILGSAAFSFYVSNFGSYEKTYGSLGAIVVFLLWLMLSAFAVLLGAELNTEMERQTRHDTTTGEPRPRGDRGAYAADTLGPARLPRQRKPSASSPPSR